jgi:hypothetical protein
MAKRTTHRSSRGKKLYAVRDKSGQFKDIQTYQRAHAADLRRTSKAESGGKKKTKKKAKKKAKKRTTKAMSKRATRSAGSPASNNKVARRVLLG